MNAKGWTAWFCVVAVCLAVGCSAPDEPAGETGANGSGNGNRTNGGGGGGGGEGRPNAGGGGKRPPKRVPPAPAQPETIGEWSVGVDPSTTAWELPGGQPPTVQLIESPTVNADVFSRLDGPFFTMFRHQFGNQMVRVFDLRDGTKRCEIPLKGMFQNNFSPSPDGSRFVTIRLDPREGVVHDVETGEVVGTFPIESNRPTVDFLDAGRLLVLEEKKTAARVVDAVTGGTLRTLDLGFPCPENRYEISPGGGYVAVVDLSAKEGRAIKFFALGDGESDQAVGHLHVPHGRHWRGAFDIAFSPDGSEFACLMGRDRVQVRVWNVATGEHVETYDVAKSGRKNVSNLHEQARRSFRGEKLLFTPDGSGFLLQGHLYLDRAARELKWGVPFSGIGGYTGPYRFVGDHLLMVKHDRQAIPEGRDQSFWAIAWPPATFE